MPSMRVPKGTLKRAERFYAGTTLRQTDIFRDALLTGLRAFEVDGYKAPKLPQPSKGLMQGR